MVGTLFNIQRFSTSDGTGIRTVVFFKGCPLNCAWCHNPESKQSKPEIFYNAGNCIGCGLCAAACLNGQHIAKDATHRYLRENCTVCGRCVERCPSRALEKCGKTYSVDEILQEVVKDRPFFEQSGGGVTLSGGEPLFQWDFCLALLKKSKEEGLHTAVETCGYTKGDIAELHPFVDMWLYDVKLLNEQDHKRYTGVSNEQILHNLHRLDVLGANITLRCPVIPDVNATKGHFTALKNLANSLQNLKEIHLEPYHPLGVDKAVRLGKIQAYDRTEFLNKNEFEDLARELQDVVSVPLVIL